MSTGPPPYGGEPQVGYQYGGEPQVGYQQQGYPPQQPDYGTYQPVGTQQQSNNTTTVVLGQPQPSATVNLVQCKPNNYIGLSLFTLLCCCWLFGIVALIFAMQVDSAYAGGDVVGAQSASHSARTWSIVGIVFGSVTLVLVVIANIIWIPIFVVTLKNEDSYDYNYDY